MKISIDWLKDYIELDISTEEIADTLSDLGFPIEEIIELQDDTVIDVEVTSNRGDCLSVIGIARELALATGKQLKLPQIDLDYMDNDVSEFIDISVTEPKLCNRYTARYLEGVKVGPTPEWMKKRIEAVGLRSVNNVVDATNYAMLETGQPPHAFDCDKLKSDKIIIRKAISGERITTIDSSKCDLGVDMLVIADEHEPICVAGVMGGLNSEVDENTTKILLETAHFDPVSVRTAGRSLGLYTDAMFRFERHVDVEMIDWASQRIATLIQMVAGGKIANGLRDSYQIKPDLKEITLRLDRLNKLIGITYEPESVLFTLKALGMNPRYNADQRIFTCTSPTWRHDIHREVDLIEEVVRVHGYNEIPIENKINIIVTGADKRQKVLKKTTSYLNSCGFFETLNITFTDDKTAELFNNNYTDSVLAVKDVTRKNANILRQTLIGSLLGNLKSNHNVGNKNCSFFEIADTFAAVNGQLDEKTKLAIVSDKDLRAIRGCLEGLLKSLNKETKIEFKPAAQPWTQVGAEIFVNEIYVGHAGIISDNIAKHFDFKDSRPAALEIDFSILMEIEGKEFKIKHLPKFPSVNRDLSVIVNEETMWEQIETAILAKAPDVLENLSYVDTYRGKQIPEGKKSLTLTMRFRDDDGTLTHEIVDKFEAKIVEYLKSEIQAELRAI